MQNDTLGQLQLFDTREQIAKKDEPQCRGRVQHVPTVTITTMQVRAPRYRIKGGYDRDVHGGCEFVQSVHAKVGVSERFKFGPDAIDVLERGTALALADFDVGWRLEQGFLVASECRSKVLSPENIAPEQHTGVI